MGEIVGVVLGPRLAVWLRDDGERVYMGSAGARLEKKQVAAHWKGLGWRGQQEARTKIRSATEDEVEAGPAA